MHRQPRPVRRVALPQEREEPVSIPNAISEMPGQVSGYPPLEGAFETIAASNCLIVVQCIEPLEILTGIETPNKYVIHDMYMRPILYAHEQSEYFDRNFNKETRDFNMHIVDRQRQLLMSSSRYGGGACSFNGDHLETWHKGNSIGKLTRDLCDSNFYLRVAGCNAQFVIVAPRSAWNSPRFRSRHTIPFPIFMQGGHKVGEIVRLDPGWMEWVSDADTFMVHFPTNMPPTIKLLLLQAVFLIDFTYFEDRELNQEGGVVYHQRY